MEKNHNKKKKNQKKIYIYIWWDPNQQPTGLPTTALAVSNMHLWKIVQTNVNIYMGALPDKVFVSMCVEEVPFAPRNIE